MVSAMGRWSAMVSAMGRGRGGRATGARRGGGGDRGGGVDRSVTAAVLRARVEASTSAISPSGRWENCRSLRHASTVVDRSAAAVVQARVEASASAIFPSGRWGSYTVVDR